MAAAPRTLAHTRGNRIGIVLLMLLLLSPPTMPLLLVGYCSVGAAVVVVQYYERNFWFATNTHHTQNTSKTIWTNHPLPPPLTSQIDTLHPTSAMNSNEPFLYTGQYTLIPHDMLRMSECIHPSKLFIRRHSGVADSWCTWNFVTGCSGLIIFGIWRMHVAYEYQYPIHRQRDW